MTQARIAFFEDKLKKPMAEPHRGWIEELLGEITGRQYSEVLTDETGATQVLRRLKKGTLRMNGKPATPEEVNEQLR